MGVKKLTVLICEDDTLENWEVVGEEECVPSGAEYQPYIIEIDTPKEGKYIRLKLEESHGADYISIQRIRLMSDSMSDKFQKLDLPSKFYASIWFVPNPRKRIEIFNELQNFFFFYEKSIAKIRRVQKAVDIIRLNEEFHTICNNVKTAFVQYVQEYESDKWKNASKTVNQDGMELRYFKSIVARTAHVNGEDISWLQYIVRVIKEKEPQIISQFLKEFMAVSDVRDVKEMTSTRRASRH